MFTSAELTANFPTQADCDAASQRLNILLADSDFASLVATRGADKMVTTVTELNASKQAAEAEVAAYQSVYDSLSAGDVKDTMGRKLYDANHSLTLINRKLESSDIISQKLKTAEATAASNQSGDINNMISEIITHRTTVPAS
jgi:hypothetical protein